jgi:hypothetical protein
MNSSQQYKSGFPAWLVIVLLLAIILGKGVFSFLVVGDQGQPTWDYRPASDVPAASPYGVYDPLPYPQHVRGEKGE